MLYDLSSPLGQSRFQRRVEALLKRGGRVELRDVAKRSLSQNSYLHLLISYFAMEVGCDAEYVKTEYYKKSANKDLFCQVVYDTLARRNTCKLRSSADLSVEEMTTSIERFRNWSSQVAGIYLPDASEQEFLSEIQSEIDRHRDYL